MRKVTVWIVCLLLAVAVPAEARARTKKKTEAQKKKERAAAAKKKKKQKQQRLAAKKKRQRKAKRLAKRSRNKKGRTVARAKLNMPPEWQWPPSEEMRREGKECLARLDALGIGWRRAPQTDRVATPIYLTHMEIGGVALESMWREGPFVMDCFLAMAFAEKGAAALRALGVKKLRFSSIHAFRYVAGKGALSRHALGLAMDVWEFVTDDDAVHVVKDDYPAGDTVLLGIETAINESGAYRYLLTPRNDPRGHDDHFHFEARTPHERVLTTESHGTH